MAYLDFVKIKEDNPIEGVMQRLGLDMKKKGNQWRGECPVSKEGGERALVITPEKGAWYSFGAKKGGDVIALVEFINGVKSKEAAAWLQSHETVPEEKVTRGEERGFKPLDYLEADHEAVIALGFDPTDADLLGVGYAKRGVMRGTVAIPVRLVDGSLVGYIGITEALLPTSWRF